MKTNRYVIGVGLSALLVAIPQLVVAAGFANTAQSATSTGMGGVATANPDEPNANFYNPAAMAGSQEWNLYLGPTVIIPSVDYTSPDGSTTAQAKDQVFPPPNLHLAVPVSDEVTAGLGVTLPWGLGIAWPSDWEGRETFRSQSLQTLNLNPNVAYELPWVDGLSVAGGLQLLRSALRQERAADIGGGREVDIVLGGVGYGAGVTAAALYELSDEVSLGLNYRSAVRLNYSGDIHFSDDVEETAFEQRMVDQPISTSITFPHTLSLGAGWQALDPLWVGVDVTYMSWSTYDEVEVHYSEQSPEGQRGESEPSMVVEGNWSDAVAIRVGGQYRLIDNRGGHNVDARLGAALDMTPVPDETVGPSLPDNNRYVFAAGVGYSFEKYRADLGYQYIHLPPRVVDNGNFNGTYQLRSHLIGLNVGYGF